MVQRLSDRDYAHGNVKELVFPKALDLDRPKRLRTTFSKEQLDALESVFKFKQYVVGKERTQLAGQLGLTENQIKVWFQNRRTKHKKEEELGGFSIVESVSPSMAQPQLAEGGTPTSTQLASRHQAHPGLASAIAPLASPLTAPMPLFFPGSLFSLQQMAGAEAAAAPAVGSNGSADTESVSPTPKQNIFRPFCL